MGIFSRRETEDLQADSPQISVPSVVTPATGTARVGEEDGYPIVPVLRERQWWDEVLQVIPEEAADQRPIITELGTELVVMYALDRPDMYQPVSSAWAQDHQMSRDQVIEEAMVWLEMATRDISITGAGGRYRVELPQQPDLVASLLLNVASWCPEDEFSGEPVFAVGTRVLLHVCGSADEEALAGLGELNQVLFDEADGKPLTPKLLSYVDGHLVVFGR